jgi:hypothetical protein
MVKTLLGFLLIVGMASTSGLASGLAPREGCGLNAFEGRTAETLFFWVIQSSVPTQFSWQVGSGDARTQKIPSRAISGHAGTGSRAWTVMQPVGDSETEIDVFERYNDGSDRAKGRIELASPPLAFTWTEDSQHAPWLFFEAPRNTISAWRHDGSVWRHEADLAGELHIPRATADAVFMGRWRIANGRATAMPRPVSEELEWFPRATEMIAFARRGAAWSTTDSGVTWKPIPMPWPTGTRGSLVDSDADVPVVTWSLDGLLHVARWCDGSWLELTVLDRHVHDVAGPIVVLGDRVILLGLCYRTNAEGASTSATVVDHGKITSTTIVMRSR